MTISILLNWALTGQKWTRNRDDRIVAELAKGSPFRIYPSKQNLYSNIRLSLKPTRSVLPLYATFITPIALFHPIGFASRIVLTHCFVCNSHMTTVRRPKDKALQSTEVRPITDVPDMFCVTCSSSSLWNSSALSGLANGGGAAKFALCHLSRKRLTSVGRQSMKATTISSGSSSSTKYLDGMCGDDGDEVTGEVAFFFIVKGERQFSNQCEWLL